MVTVGLVDKVTKPIQGINDQLRKTGQTAQQSWQHIAGGAAGLLASGAALYTALQPAIEMDDALAEVKSLGVVQDDLDLLRKTARHFSVEFGESATDFVKSAYDIKSAMGDMTGKELAGITEASAVLAKGTKSDAETVTKYMGSMYSIFKNQAEAMGKDNFAAMIAGQTAQAVETFKTSGTEMSAAFSSLGSSAAAMGVNVTEQLAVLGTLQGSMGGARAGTQYTAFIDGAISAQKKLGMSFQDSRGKLLPMVQILGKLKDKVGDMGEADQYKVLKDAFGSTQAVKLIQNLMPDIDGLAASINNVGQQTGMDKATQMAQDMTSQFDRLTKAFWAVREGAGNSILPTVINMTASMADNVALVAEWTEMFPHLTEVVTWVAVGIGGLTAVMAAWAVVAGIASLALGAVSWPILVIAAAIGALVLLWDPLSAFFSGLFGALGDDLPIVFGPLLRLFNIVKNFFGWMLGGMADLLPGMEGMGEGFSTLQWLGEMLGFAISNALMLIFNPLEFIRRAIDTLKLAWEAMVSFFTEGDFMAPVRDDFAKLGPVFENIGIWFGELKAGWQSFMNMLGNLNPIDMLGSAIDRLIEKLNMIPGINIKTSGAMPEAAKVTQEVNRSYSGAPIEKSNLAGALSPGQDTINQRLSAARTPAAISAPSAPLMPQMAKMASQNSGKMVQFGDVHIKNEQGMDPQAMAEWEELQHGF